MVAQTSGGWEQQTKKEGQSFDKGTGTTENKIRRRLFSESVLVVRYLCYQLGVRGVEEGVEALPSTCDVVSLPIMVEGGPCT